MPISIRQLCLLCCRPLLETMQLNQQTIQTTNQNISQICFTQFISHIHCEIFHYESFLCHCIYDSVSFDAGGKRRNKNLKVVKFLM